jgi:hypothetical protein
MFQQPSAGGDKVPFGDLVGSLALIWVRDYRTGITTVHGEKDAVGADVHILDGPKGGEVFENSLIFQGALIGALKPAVGGEPVLARIGQGTPKPGQNAPFVLNPFTAQDAVLATGYIQRMPQQFQAPNGQQAPPPPPPAATAPAAATPSPAAASPATANPPAVAPMTTATPAGSVTPEVFAALPLEVQELLRQSGQAPAGV